MLNILRRQKGEYVGDCEYPNCPNKILSYSKHRKYCISHVAESHKNVTKFRKELKAEIKKVEEIQDELVY